MSNEKHHGPYYLTGSLRTCTTKEVTSDGDERAGA